MQYNFFILIHLPFSLAQSDKRSYVNELLVASPITELADKGSLAHIKIENLRRQRERYSTSTIFTTRFCNFMS